MALDLTSPAAIFMAGVVTSLHCTVMCGPLACAVLPKQKSLLATVVYHAARVTSYVIIGGILGAAGKSAASIFASSPVKFLPWVLIALFVALGLGLEKRFTPPRFISRFLPRAAFGGAAGIKGAFTLGIATPFLPCSPLYLVFGVALFSGSFAGGAIMMALFAAGTLPLYGLALSQAARLQARLSPVVVQRSRRGLALLSAVLLAWRVTAAGGAGLASIHCPFCL